MIGRRTLWNDLTDHRQTLLFLGLAVLVITAGCQTEPPGERKIGIEEYEMNQTSSGEYVFSGTVGSVSHRTDARSYSDVSIHFYDEAYTEFDVVYVGEVPADDPQTVTHRLPQRPEYILLWSPAFETDSNLEVSGLKHYSDGRYIGYSEYAVEKFHRNSSLEW